MTKVSVAVDFDAPPREVWEIIGDFNALPRWHPGIAGSRIEYGEEGTQRVLKSPDGSEFIERFVGANYRGYAYTYAIISGPLPVTGYVATLSLTEREGGGARARWESEFTPEGADEATLSAKMEAFYHQGFANLASVIAARRAAAERRKRPGTPV